MLASSPASILNQRPSDLGMPNRLTLKSCRFSKREQSIIAFIADGQSNKKIARMLGVTPETVKTHVKRIFNKLSAETRAQAVVRAQSLGFLH
jgi:DNA-binding NarL/FixJ family response regulator